MRPVSPGLHPHYFCGARPVTSANKSCLSCSINNSLAHDPDHRAIFIPLHAQPGECGAPPGSGFSSSRVLPINNHGSGKKQKPRVFTMPSIREQSRRPFQILRHHPRYPSERLGVCPVWGVGKGDALPSRFRI